MNFHETYPDTCSTVAIAARLGDVQSIKKLIKNGRPVDVKDNRGWMPVHEAAYRGHTECLKILLDTVCVCVEEKTFEMETPILLAARGGNSQCIKVLLQAGADPNSSTLEGLSPLWEACWLANMECSELLLSGHAHVNHATYTMDTPLHGLIQTADHAPLVSLLLSHGADIRKRSENGLTPLFVAAQFGQIDSLRLLLQEAERKGNSFLQHYVNMPANDKTTPLYIATQEQHADCVELLLHYHGNAALGPVIDNKGEEATLIPLLAAVNNRDLRCVELLAPAIDKYPDKFPPFTDETRPLLMALQDGETSIVKHLSGYLSPEVQLADWISATNNLYCAITVAKNFDYHGCYDRSVGRLALQICNHIGGVQQVKEEMLLLFLRLGAQLENRLPQMVDSSKRINGNLLLYVAQRKYCRLRNCEVRDPNIHRCMCNKWYKTRHHMPSKMCLQTNLTHVSNNQLGADTVTVRRIKDTCNTLRHRCRVAVIYQLLVTNRCTRETIQSLPLPQILKSYLQFQDLDSTGEMFMHHCERLVELEEKIDDAFRELNFIPHIDR